MTVKVWVGAKGADAYIAISPTALILRFAQDDRPYYSLLTTHYSLLTKTHLIPIEAKSKTKHMLGIDIVPCHSTQKMTLGMENIKIPARRKYCSFGLLVNT